MKVKVTVTFAQSLDGKLAGSHGSQLTLSGPDSMRMTHQLRSTHDAILIGANTAINDNPQLNTRLLPQANQSNPQPIVLDNRLRFPTTAKLLANYNAGTGRQPWIITTDPNPDQDRKQALEQAGARVISVPPTIPALLDALYALSIRSLMVEGGPTVISSFIDAHLRHKNIIDSLIITIAPIFVGSSGLTYSIDADLLAASTTFTHSHSYTLGKDSIVVLTG